MKKQGSQLQILLCCRNRLKYVLTGTNFDN